MRHHISIGKEPKLQKLVIISAILHLTLILFTIIPLKTGRREFKSYYVSLVGPLEISKGGFRVQGEIGIAKKEKPSVTQKETISDKTVDSNKKTEEIKKEIERLRAIRELSKQKQKRMEEIEIIRKRMNEEVIGATHNEEGVDSDSYYAIISEMIWSKWVYPDTGFAGLEVIISIRIDGKGNIVYHEIEKGSGNALFDQSALRAISKANPLPPPPTGIETEVGIRFYL